MWVWVCIFLRFNPSPGSVLLFLWIVYTKSSLPFEFCTLLSFFSSSCLKSCALPFRMSVCSFRFISFFSRFFIRCVCVCDAWLIWEWICLEDIYFKRLHENHLCSRLCHSVRRNFFRCVFLLLFCPLLLYWWLCIPSNDYAIHNTLYTLDVFLTYLQHVSQCQCQCQVEWLRRKKITQIMSVVHTQLTMIFDCKLQNSQQYVHNFASNTTKIQQKDIKKN